MGATPAAGRGGPRGVEHGTLHFVNALADGGNSAKYAKCANSGGVGWFGRVTEHRLLLSRLLRSDTLFESSNVASLQEG